MMSLANGSEKKDRQKAIVGVPVVTEQKVGFAGYAARNTRGHADISTGSRAGAEPTKTRSV